MPMPIGDRIANTKTDVSKVVGLAFDAHSSIPITNEITNLCADIAPNMNQTFEESYNRAIDN